MPWFLYILQCADGSFYTGISEDPEQRFRDHRDKKGSRYTRRQKSVQPAGLFAMASRAAAEEEERRVKKLSRKNKERLIDSADNLLRRAHPSPESVLGASSLTSVGTT